MCVCEGPVPNVVITTLAGPTEHANPCRPHGACKPLPASRGMQPPAGPMGHANPCTQRPAGPMGHANPCTQRPAGLTEHANPWYGDLMLHVTFRVSFREGRGGGEGGIHPPLPEFPPLEIKFLKETLAA